MPDIKPKSQSATEIEDMYAADETPVVSMAPPKKKKGGKAFLTLILIIILVLVVFLIIAKITTWDPLGFNDWLSGPTATNGTEIVKASDWQAVFLTNGQVYFGKLKGANDNYPVLEDIYYLQVQEVPIQPAEPATEEEGVQPAVQTQQQTILVKFGTELHKPMDKMYINKDHILMFEDLASDSNVVIAIEDYKAQIGN